MKNLKIINNVIGKAILATSILLVAKKSNALPSVYSSEGKIIECLQKSHEALKMQVEIGEMKSENWGLISQNYKAKFHSLHGPRLVGDEYDAEVTVHQVTTRVLFGLSYHLTIPGIGTLSVQDTKQSWNEEQFPTGFYGEYETEDGKIIEVSCSYLETKSVLEN